MKIWILRCLTNNLAEQIIITDVFFIIQSRTIGFDALNNDDPGFDVAADATATADFMRALGAADADLVVVEQSDRDAAFNDRWWDPTNATLPHFHQALEWVKVLGEEMDLAPLWWQVPYGHMGLSNNCDTCGDPPVISAFPWLPSVLSCWYKGDGLVNGSGLMFPGSRNRLGLNFG